MWSTSIQESFTQKNCASSGPSKWMVNKAKRSLVAWKWISYSLEMDGLGIPHPHETIKGFRQNLIQRIYRQNRTKPTANLLSILAALLNKANRPTLVD
jgi:hypothetical protein